MAVPTATPTTEKVVLDEPAGIVMGVCTVATAVLLLASATAVPPVDAAAVRVTVPWLLLPTATLAALSVTPDMAIVFEGAADEPEPPHCTKATAATTVAASVMNGVARGLILTRNSLR